MLSIGTAALAASMLVSGASAVDHLYSKRHLNKRQDAGSNFNISFYHINDVHAHLDEFSSSGTDCTNPSRGCYGGYSRVKHVIDRDRPGINNSLFLNAGDEFQGTLFYTYYKGEKIAETLNQLGFDAMTLGNHEFDGGDDLLGDFLANLTFPITSCNIQSTQPILNRTILPFVEFPQYNLAVIGVTTETTPSIANVGEGTTFSPAIEAVQHTIDTIRTTTNISRIAALTHIGYEEDQKLAQQTTGLHLIMGGHSHTPLGNASQGFDEPEGPYPTIVENSEGEEVFIVTAFRWGEYLGYIDVIYDSTGRIIEYHGAPIHLTNTTEQDPGLQAQVESWRGPFEAFAAEVVGETEVVLEQSTCRRQECLLGNFMADAMLTYRRNQSDEVDFALINGGGIRATIEEGPVTRGEVLTSFPFGNSAVELVFNGTELWDALEGMISGVSVFNGRPVTNFFQVSRDIQIDYNPANANLSKLVNVIIRGEPLDRGASYTVVTLDFLAGGGDNFWEPRTDFAVLDLQDVILTNYVQSESPINIALEGRIRQVNGTATNGTSGVGGNGSAGAGGESSTPNAASASQPLLSGVIAAGVLAVFWMAFDL
jgi:5'-nucleotidase